MHKTFSALSLGLALSLGAMGLAYAEQDDNPGKAKGKSDEVKVQELKGHIMKLQDQIQEMLKIRAGLVVKKDEWKSASSTEDKKEIKVEMKEMRGDLHDAQKGAKVEVKFIRSLMRGMSGDDVRDLQELLAEDPDVYPEGLITGFFGPATERALKKFQKKHGIEQVGIFGPKSRAKIHMLFEGRWPPGIMKRFGMWASTTATTTPGFLQITICHYPPGNVEAKHTLSIGIAALAAHLLHGDKIGACEGGTATTTPPTATTTPDMVAPVISAISSTSTTASTTSIMWTTNEAADSVVWYGTTTPLSLMAPTWSVSSAALVTSHAMNLVGLSASTTHYYVVQSKDAAGNSATSSEQMFLTLP